MVRPLRLLACWIATVASVVWKSASLLKTSLAVRTVAGSLRSICLNPPTTTGLPKSNETCVPTPIPVEAYSVSGLPSTKCATTKPPPGKQVDASRIFGASSGRIGVNCPPWPEAVMTNRTRLDAIVRSQETRIMIVPFALECVAGCRAASGVEYGMCPFRRGADSDRAAASPAAMVAFSCSPCKRPPLDFLAEPLAVLGQPFAKESRARRATPTCGRSIPVSECNAAAARGANPAVGSMRPACPGPDASPLHDETRPR